MNDEYYKAVTIPEVYHNQPAVKLQFNTGSTAGMHAINGYFYHVEFKYDDQAFIGDEPTLRAYVETITEPNFF